MQEVSYLKSHKHACNFVCGSYVHVEILAKVGWHAQGPKGKHPHYGGHTWLEVVHGIICVRFNNTEVVQMFWTQEGYVQGIIHFRCFPGRMEKWSDDGVWECEAMAFVNGEGDEGICSMEIKKQRFRRAIWTAFLRIKWTSTIPPCHLPMCI